MKDPINILLVEDNPGDIYIIVDELQRSRFENKIHICVDGNEALDFLEKKQPFENTPKPDFIIMDLNLPRRDGRELLNKIKANPEYEKIPLVVFSGSKADQGILEGFDPKTRIFIRKPKSLNELDSVIKQIEAFWINQTGEQIISPLQTGEQIDSPLQQ